MIQRALDSIGASLLVPSASARCWRVFPSSHSRWNFAHRSTGSTGYGEDDAAMWFVAEEAWR